MRNWILASSLVAIGAVAQAQDSPDESATGHESATDLIAGGDALAELEAFASEGTLSDEELGLQRAKENIDVTNITINDQQTDGTVTDNVAQGNDTGDNLINGSAFSDSSGFLSTVQNTGNNVLIQNSTIINVSVDAGPSN